jgi:hypothetical protein
MTEVKVIILLYSFLVMIVSNAWRFYIFKKDIFGKLMDIRDKTYCYSCNEPLFVDKQDYYRIKFDQALTKSNFFKTKYPTECKSCNRDVKISYLNDKMNFFILKFKRFILSDLPEKTIILLIFTLPILIFSLFKGEHSDILSIVNNSIISFYWTMQIIQNYYIVKIKIPSDKEGI